LGAKKCGDEDWELEMSGEGVMGGSNGGDDGGGGIEIE
jgi:hypothetical protein